MIKEKLKGLLKNKKLLIIISASLAAMVIIAVAVAQAVRPGMLWVNGTQLDGISGGIYLTAGNGRANYDADAKTLRLDGATLSENYEGAAVYSQNDIIISLSGDNIIVGDETGIYCEGNLTLTGSGTLQVRGGTDGIKVLGKVTVGEECDVILLGETNCAVNGSISFSSVHRIEAGESEDDGDLGRNWQGAKWMHIHVPATVSFDGRGGTQPEAISVPWGSSLGEMEQSEMEGYYFDGWFLDENLYKAAYSDIKVTEDLTLYAGWTKTVYVSFDSWGGSEVETIAMRMNTTLEKPEDPVKTDQIFAGWYADDDLINPYDYTLPVTGDMCLYAKWDKVCDASYMGIDVSSFQKDIDWKAVAEDGVQFAILRAGFRGYGSTGSLNEDDYFKKNLAGATAAGLDVGCYFYCQSVTEAEAIEEAEYLLGLIGDTKLTLPIFLDFEIPTDSDGKEIGRLANAGLNGEENAAICLAFCERIEKAGFTAMVYAGKGHLYEDDMAGILENAGYGVWLAHYRIQTTYTGKYVFWQYSNKGTVNGISGDVDMDYRYITVPEKVTGLTAERGEDGVRLSWERVPGCYAYRIYRFDNQTKNWEAIDTVTGAGITEYLDTQAPASVSCEYKVAAYVVQSGVEYIGEESESAGVKPLRTDEDGSVFVNDTGIVIYRVNRENVTGYVAEISDPALIMTAWEDTEADAENMSVRYDAQFCAGCTEETTGFAIKNGAVASGNRDETQYILGIDVNGQLRIGNMTGRNAADTGMKWALSGGFVLISDGKYAVLPEFEAVPETDTDTREAPEAQEISALIVGQKEDGTVIVAVLYSYGSEEELYTAAQKLMSERGAVLAGTVSGDGAVMVFKGELFDDKNTQINKAVLAVNP